MIETGYNFEAITASDTVNFVAPTGAKLNSMIGIHFGAAGVAVIVDKDGTAHTVHVAAGSFLPIRAIRINASATTITAGSATAIFR